MAKYYGSVGFATTVESEDSPGDWIATIKERQYSGEVIRRKRTWNTNTNLNDDIAVNNEISILADPYAYQNLGEIRYVVWHGTKWRVTSIDVAYPRITLSIGGVYNGDSGPEA